MLSKIKENLFEKELLSSNDKILCAVSGGKDSMAMIHALIRLGLQVGVVHINHKTRAGASDLDCEFVKNYALKNNIAFFSSDFNFDNKGNFQARARVFRYQFFNKVLEQNNYDWVATAHHQQDVNETFLINLTRGTGLNGLLGISGRTDRVIRPMINIKLSEIELYIKENDIDFREDSSNAEDHYQRNRIRHHVLPAFEGLYKDYEYGFEKTVQNLNRTRELLDELSASYISYTEFDNPCVKKSRLAGFRHNVDLLYHLFSFYGFNWEQISDLYQSSLGSIIESDDYILVNDRIAFTLMEKRLPIIKQVLNKEGDYRLLDGRILSVRVTEDHKGIPFANNPFPILVRSRIEGDKFKPSGMKGQTKSLRKYLTDEKFSFEAKKYLLVVEKSGEIRGIVGGRNAHFGETPSHFLQLSLS